MTENKECGCGESCDCKEIPIEIEEPKGKKDGFILMLLIGLVIGVMVFYITKTFI